MSLTVTLVSNSSRSVDMRWSSTSSVQGSSRHFCLVNVAPNHASTAVHEWTVVVRDSTTSALRFDLEQSGVVGTPLVTVRCCRVTSKSVLEDERWRVEQVGKSSTVSSAAASDGDRGLEWQFSRMSFSQRPPTSTSGYKLLLYSVFIHRVCSLREFVNFDLIDPNFVHRVGIILKATKQQIYFLCAVCTCYSGCV